MKNSGIGILLSNRMNKDAKAAREELRRRRKDKNKSSEAE